MLNEVVIHPFGKVKVKLVKAIKSAIEHSFGVKVAIGRSVAVPVRAFDMGRKQYPSTDLLNELALRMRGDPRIALGIATVDIFVPELNFVFGEASSVDRVAVFSLTRIDPLSYSAAADETLLTRRAITEAVHELGHVFGLGHCDRQNCVMWFSNTLTETDHKGSRTCDLDGTRLIKLSGDFDQGASETKKGGAEEHEKYC